MPRMLQPDRARRKHDGDGLHPSRHEPRRMRREARSR